jgi:hypothetical protein
VLCFDASGGHSFAALGDAVALARSELGVDIDIDPSVLVPHGERSLADADCAVGTIRFPGGETGRLIYARTVMSMSAPWDVHAYHEADRTFPHDPSADQLYTDQKFEAYRVLGECAGRHAAEALDEPAKPPRDGRFARTSATLPHSPPVTADRGVDVAR